MNHKKIAELANVSVSTVSKALSGSSEISRETADKIRRIAIEIGYFKEKSKRKREYTNNNSILIALLVPEVMGFHYANLITCIKNEAEARGSQVAVYIFDFDKNKRDEILDSIILRGKTDGIIMFSHPNPETKYNIPIVCCESLGAPHYDSVGYSMGAVMEDSLNFLSKLGHKKIGFVGELNTASSAEAFRTSMKQSRLPVRDDFMYIIDDRFEAIGVKAAKKIVSQSDRPTAIITAYDEVALALIHELSKNGIRVPEDISVMGKNNIPAAAYAQIPLTTVDIFSDEQYKTAVELLLEKIKNEASYVKRITIQHKVIPRATTREIREETT